MSIYRATGFMPDIAFTVTNDDPTSAAGRNTIRYIGVTLDEVTLQKLDVDDAVLEQNISGDFEDFIPISRFDRIQGMN
jgi:hypothetical protein